MTGRRIVAVVVASLAALIVVPASPAAATTWSSRSLGHTPYSCQTNGANQPSLYIYRYVSAGAAIYAVARDQCGHYAFVSGSPTGGYRIERTPFTAAGDVIDSVARDGATTYFLRSRPSASGRLELWRRSSAGAYALVRTLSSYAATGLGRYTTTALAAVGGHWTAAWAQVNKYQQRTAYVATTMPGHTGRAEALTATQAGVAGIPRGALVVSSGTVELVVSVSSSSAVSTFVTRNKTTGWTAMRLIASQKRPSNSNASITPLDVAQHGATTYVLHYREVSSSVSDVEVTTDNGSSTHRSVLPASGAGLPTRMAVDAANGRICIVAVTGSNASRTDIFTNVTGGWASHQLALGSDVGLDAVGYYSGRASVYYSPAGTPQDTVRYQH